MANAKIQPFTSLDQSKHHCYTLSTTCTLFQLASEVGPRTNKVHDKYLALSTYGGSVSRHGRCMLSSETNRSLQLWQWYNADPSKHMRIKV